MCLDLNLKFEGSNHSTMKLNGLKLMASFYNFYLESQFFKEKNAPCADHQKLFSLCNIFCKTFSLNATKTFVKFFYRLYLIFPF
jgi:hypothetical protein